MRGIQMKKTVLATILTTVFLAGCSSNGGSNHSPESPVNPIEKVAPILDKPAGINPDENASTYADIIHSGGAVVIKGDNDNFVTVKAGENGNAGIIINGGEQTYVVIDGELFNYETGDSVGHIQKDGDNYTIRLDSGTEVVFRNEDGRLFAAVISRPTPDNGLPPTDDAVDNENRSLPFSHNGIDLVLDTSTGLITKDGVVVASFTRDGHITGTVVDHATGNEYKIWKDANGINVDWVNSTIDGSWGDTATPEPCESPHN